MKTRVSIIPVLAIVLAMLSAGCAQAGVESQQTAVQFSLKVSDTQGNLLVDKTANLSKGTNALEAMKLLTQVDYEDFSFGAFVKSINGYSAPEGYFLALYVNGTMADKGISSYALETDTLIEWKTEKIESFGS